jgi:hypothetical protein
MFHSALAAIKGSLMAKPNYQFEKRQRDLAKKAKQEEKRRQKLAGKAATDEGSGNVAPNLPEATPSSAKTSAEATPDTETTPKP